MADEEGRNGDGEPQSTETEVREKSAAQKKREKKKLKQQQMKEQESSGAAPSTEPKDGGEKKKPAAAKKKGGKEEKKETRKGPSKSTIAAIQAAIQKAKEEEEALLREEEEKERKLQEAEERKKEALRLEQERKERKKQKEKEKKERLKAEGKLLSQKEKLKRQRAQAMLENLRAQGVEVPEAGGEKKHRPGTRIRTKKNQPSQTSLSTDTEGKENEEHHDRIGSPGSDVVENAVPEIEDPGECSEEKIKDAWDEESEEEVKKEDGDSDSDGFEKLSKSASMEDSQASEEVKSLEIGANEDDEDSSDDEEGSGGSDSGKCDAKKENAAVRIAKRREANEKARSVKNLRSPVVCVLGHVDTGKTKILDKLRRTHVQDGEAGGITQQIGATNVPIEAIKEATKFVKNSGDVEVKVPGLLIIDTPGHESFSNLRSRGSSLCDIAILVVDIMHGLEPQTIESLNMLRAKKTPFIVALNKIDRLYEWQTFLKKDIRDVIKSQPQISLLEFEKRTKEVIVQFQEQGLNAELFYQNPDTKSYISIVPTSAVTGEGMGNLMGLIVEYSQEKLAKRLMYSQELQATVLEVKAIPGLGTTIDVILVNGTLHEGDTIIVAGSDGPIVTQIRSLLTPQPMKELRVKNTYIEYKELSGAVGVKIAGKELEKAIAGFNLLVATHPDEVELCKEEVAREIKSALNAIKLNDRGVYVQASTLGSLEALLEFLKTSGIPYAGIRIGPVVKKDVMKASIMLEHDSQYAVILAFDVKIERDAQELADNLGVRIFQADIIYHLFDKFMAYRDELKAKKKDEFKHIAVFPCKLKILPQFVFNTRDPIVVGVVVEAGTLRDGTPICVPNRENVDLGRVTSIEKDHKPLDKATKGQEVCIKIEPSGGDAPKLLGRHFEITDTLVSKISRESIDACKDYFRSDLQNSDWKLMVELKKLFEIM